MCLRYRKDDGFSSDKKGVFQHLMPEIWGPIAGIHQLSGDPTFWLGLLQHTLCLQFFQMPPEVRGAQS